MKQDINLPLFILDFILILPLTILRLFLIYMFGSRYNIPNLKIFDIIQHADTKQFNNKNITTEYQSATSTLTKMLNGTNYNSKNPQNNNSTKHTDNSIKNISHDDYASTQHSIKNKKITLNDLIMTSNTHTTNTEFITNSEDIYIKNVDQNNVNDNIRDNMEDNISKLIQKYIEESEAEADDQNVIKFSNAEELDELSKEQTLII